MERGNRKIREGVVVRSKMNKTVVVEVERVYRHPFYQKIVREAKSYMVHDEKNESKVGDLVEIAETRPLSKNKRWRLLRILGKAKIAEMDYPAAKEKKVDSAA